MSDFSDYGLLVDEVTSIILMVALVLALANYFETNPVPFLIVAVMSTNVGSTGTVLGNPIGILIATKAGLTFEDFLLQAFPLMLLVLITTIGLVLFWYRHQIGELDKKIREYDNSRGAFAKLVCVPLTKEIKRNSSYLLLLC